MAVLVEIEIRVAAGTPAAGAVAIWELLTDICEGPIESWHNPKLAFRQEDGFINSASLKFNDKIYRILSVIS